MTREEIMIQLGLYPVNIDRVNVAIAEIESVIATHGNAGKIAALLLGQEMLDVTEGDSG